MLALFVGALIVLVMLTNTLSRSVRASPLGKPDRILGAGFGVLCAWVAIGTLLGAEVGQATLGFTVGHAVATVTWMLAGAWLLLRGLGRSRDADLTLRTGLVDSFLVNEENLIL